MQVTIDKIEIVHGEFTVTIVPGENGKEDDKQVSFVGQYALLGPKNIQIGQGQITNTVQQGANSIDLSPKSLEAFKDFYESVQQDIGNGISGESNTDDSVANLLGKR